MAQTGIEKFGEEFHKRLKLNMDRMDWLQCTGDEVAKEWIIELRLENERQAATIKNLSGRLGVGPFTPHGV